MCIYLYKAWLETQLDIVELTIIYMGILFSPGVRLDRDQFDF